MAAFADFLDLRTAVLEMVGRTDIADVFPRLAALAEARFNREIRHGDQISSATVTFASGVATLPADFAEAIGLYDTYGREYIQQPPQQVRPTNLSGRYTVKGSTLEMRGFSGDVTLDYYATIPSAADSMTDSNWLLQKYPDVYLYGVAFEAAKYLRDMEMGATLRGLADQAIDELRADDNRTRYSRARIRVMGVTP